MRHHHDRVHHKYAELFSVAYALDNLSNEIFQEFNSRDLKLFNIPSPNRIFLFILTRSLKTYSSILFICEKGYGQDVSSLLRSLLENLITARYILHDPKHAGELAKRFVAYKWIIFKRHLPEEEKIAEAAGGEKKEEFLKRKEAILAKAEDFKKTFRVTSDRGLLTWSGKTVRDMAKSVDPALFLEYETTFRLCSRFSHPSILGDQEYMIQDDRHLIFSPLPSDIGIMPHLSNTITYALDFLQIFSHMFHLGFSGKLKTLESQMIQVLRSEKYRKENLPAPKPETPPQPIRECVIQFRTHQDPA